MTSSLFATTVLASFFVVTLPHVLPPCPAPRVALADGEMPDGSTKRRRRRRPDADMKEGQIVRFQDIEADIQGTMRQGAKRECPVPKPGGLVGEILGFRSESKEPRSSPER
jgi:cytochrome c oxidase assembly factor 2